MGRRTSFHNKYKMGNYFRIGKIIALTVRYVQYPLAVSIQQLSSRFPYFKQSAFKLDKIVSSWEYKINNQYSNIPYNEPIDRGVYIISEILFYMFLFVIYSKFFKSKPVSDSHHNVDMDRRLDHLTKENVNLALELETSQAQIRELTRLVYSLK